MNPKQLQKVGMDPENRRLIRLTINDLEEDIKNFAILHSDKKKDSEARAKMFETFKLDREDIDN